MVKRVVVVPYNEQWKTDFETIKQHLLPAVKDTIISIEHIGSTSVEGLSAKPIIGIDIVIKDYSVFDEVVKRPASLGYKHEGNLGIKDREAFDCEGNADLPKHHLYVCPEFSAEPHKHITFRDYLRNNPEAMLKYSKGENKELKYKCSLTSAKEFSEAGKLEDWVHLFLLSDGHNKAFSNGLKLFDRYYLGSKTMPLSLFSRCCGPEDDIKYQVNAEWFEKRVQSLKKALQSNKDMPPLIVHYVDHDFELCDGNHRFETLSQLDVKEYPVIVWMTEKEEYDEFIKNYMPQIKQLI